MESIPIKHLKRGYGINHPDYGHLQYRGLVTRNPFTNEVKVPHEYLFWQVVNEDGKTKPDVILTDGNFLVEVSDKIEDYD